MTFWLLTSYSNFPTDKTFHQFHKLDTKHDHRITSGFMDNMQRVRHASRKRLPFRTSVSVPFWFTYAPIVETNFPVSFLCFSPWISLGTFSILLIKDCKVVALIHLIKQWEVPLSIMIHNHIRWHLHWSDIKLFSFSLSSDNGFFGFSQWILRGKIWNFLRILN